MSQPNPEVAYWQSVALYLADCWAASGETAMKKSTSKYERQRIVMVMDKARRLLREETMPPTIYYHGRRNMDEVTSRLDSNIEKITAEYPESA